MQTLMQIPITVTVNGVPKSSTVQAGWSLLDFLRQDAGATDVKCGCNQGDCGTCTVIYDGRAVKSCLVLAAQANGKQVFTLKGLTADSLMRELQEAFLQHGAIQCGFCTPGMLVAAWSLLRQYPQATREEMREGISGNLCRCTGYKKILDAMADVAQQGADRPKEFPEAFQSDPVPSLAGNPLPGQKDAQATYLLLGGG